MHIGLPESTAQLSVFLSIIHYKTIQTNKMKKYILLLTAVSAIAISGCRKIETDGEKEIVIINGGGSGGSTSGQTITLQGRINADTLLKKENTYILKGLVYMVGNHTMTIQAGTVIKGSFSGSDVASLIITRGSKIIAQGAVTDPIVFTSLSPSPQSGDWGGIIICGKAAINTSFNGVSGLYQVEGGVDNAPWYQHQLILTIPVF
jgi:hypothetical protein